MPFQNLFIDEFFKHPQYFWDVCITVILSICIHELSHGIVAIWHGDRTPIETGHMTMNPIKHMGAMSLALLLMAGIAWGAMPVNPGRLRGRHARALVAIAGPVANVLMAGAAILALGLWIRFFPMDDLSPENRVAENFQYFLQVFGILNIAPVMFNLLPIPPLDGSRVLADFSAGYAQMMQSMRAGGGASMIFLVIFWYSGTYIMRGADSIWLRSMHFVIHGN